jgi:hypothetical protein
MTNPLFPRLGLVLICRLSLYHKENPYKMHVNGEEFSVDYWPADSKSGMFGGNSNWRGPIWLATTFLLIESLQRFYQVRLLFSFFVALPFYMLRLTLFFLSDIYSIMAPISR